jgi:hypothetical protein
MTFNRGTSVVAIGANLVAAKRHCSEVAGASYSAHHWPMSLAPRTKILIADIADNEERLRRLLEGHDLSSFEPATTPSPGFRQRGSAWSSSEFTSTNLKCLPSWPTSERTRYLQYIARATGEPVALQLHKERRKA